MPHLDHMDVTKRINLADPQQVCAEVCDLLCTADAAVDRPFIEQAFAVFAQLYGGTLPGYHRCETMYHDMHHALDVTLAAARMMAGYESVHSNGNRFGAERLTLGIIVALYHDTGYIRRRGDRKKWHGAQYTLVHVSRGARFLTHYLKQEGRDAWARRAARLIHFTGYEVPIAEIRLKDPLDRLIGSLIGTADLIAQMADRVYLEKCRDFLYDEFALGGMVQSLNPDGSVREIYDSGNDLLCKTPMFYAKMVKKRLDEEFGQIYHSLEPLFGGANPYLDAMERNMTYLQKILDDGHLTEKLRRQSSSTT